MYFSGRLRSRWCAIGSGSSTLFLLLSFGIQLFIPVNMGKIISNRKNIYLQILGPEQMYKATLAYFGLHVRKFVILLQLLAKINVFLGLNSLSLKKEKVCPFNQGKSALGRFFVQIVRSEKSSKIGCRPMKLAELTCTNKHKVLMYVYFIVCF